jgi:hypothetical protein
MANLPLKMRVHYIHSEQQQPSAIVKHMHSTLLQLSCLDFIQTTYMHKYFVAAELLFGFE